MFARYAAVAGLLLAACTPAPALPPQFAAAPFMTRAEVPLRSGPADSASTIALLPPRTPLLSLETGPTEWKVDTPDGAGWLYVGYISPRGN